MTPAGAEGEREVRDPVTLVATTDDLNTIIVILDANLEPVRLHENLSQVEVELDPGVYTVQFCAGTAVVEKQVVLRPGSAPEYVKLTADEAPRFISAAPLHRTASTREVDQDMAMALSLTDPVTLEGHAGGSHLLVFIRDPSGGSGKRVDGGLELRDPAGKLLANLAEIGQQIPKDRQSGVHLNLDPGVYRLGLNIGDGIRLEQSIATAVGWQTQVFLTVDDFGSSNDLLPSLWDMSVMFAHANRGFDPGSQDARYSELALLALEGGNALPASDRRTMFRDKFDNPMLGILALHLHLQRKKINEDLVTEVLRNLFNLLGPIPDVIALALACEARLDVERHPAFLKAFLAENLPLGEPPMLRAGWRCVVDASHARQDIIAHGSLAEEISGCLAASGPWLLWRGDLATRTTDVSPEEVSELASDSQEAGDTVSTIKSWINNAIQALAQWSLDGVITMLIRALAKHPETYELLQSDQFTEAERRVAYFVRPALEPSLWGIVQQFPGLTRRLEDRSPEDEGWGEALVRELQVPAGTAMRLCFATWWKVIPPVLPDKNRLNAFITSECHDVAPLKRILRSLDKFDTGVRQIRLEREVTGLEMLYLRYRNSPILRTKSLSAQDLADVLNDAGYRAFDRDHPDTSEPNKVTVADIDALIAELQKTIHKALARARSNRELIDEILASDDVTVAPANYRRGHLFPVRWKDPEESEDGENQ